jgi:hypothetical protein
MAPMLNIAPIVVTIALADVTNLPLILDFAPILTPWFELCSSFLASHLIRFWHDFIGLLSYFVIQSRRCLWFWTGDCKILFPGCYARRSKPRANHVHQSRRLLLANFSKPPSGEFPPEHRDMQQKSTGAASMRVYFCALQSL